MSPLDHKQLTISYLAMRKAIGWLGMLLPFILLVGNYVINHSGILNSTWFFDQKCQCPYMAGSSVKSSVSHYYYSAVGELFTGILSAVALFMFCYKGYPKHYSDRGLSDTTMTNLAGFFALGVVIFPTGSSVCITDNLRSFVSSENTGKIHFTFAALFFITLAFMSIINFRRTGERKTFGKRDEHKVYLIYGMVILGSITLIAFYSLAKNYGLLNNSFDRYKPVFWLETLALIAFGGSWLKKGGTDVLYVPRKLGIDLPFKKNNEGKK